MPRRALTLVASALVALALIAALSPSAARADDGGTSSGGGPTTSAPSADETSVGAGVDTQQPETSVAVLPSHCLEQGLTLPRKATLCRVTRFGAKRPTVVVWGDSHSWQQTRGIVAMARQTRTNLITFQMGACPPMDLTGKGIHNGCADNAALALDFIKTKVRRGGRRDLTVVLGAFWHLYRDYADRSARGWVPESVHDIYLAQEAQMFRVGGNRLFRTLDRLKVRTAGIGQMPWVSPEAPACEASSAASYGCDLPRATAIEDEAATARWLEARTDVYVDATPYVCDASVCRATTGGRATFLDELHLNPAISDAFAPAYRRVFRAWR